MHARVHSTVRWAPAARESSPPLQRLFSAPACRSITAYAVVLELRSNICQVGEPPEKVVGVSIRLLLSGAKGRGEGFCGWLAGWLPCAYRCGGCGCGSTPARESVGLRLWDGRQLTGGEGSCVVASTGALVRKVFAPFLGVWP